MRISYAGCLGLSPAIWEQFTLEMCRRPKKNSIKSSILKVQAH